jgi:hypothetical protein
MTASEDHEQLLLALEGKFFVTMMAAFAAPVGPPRSAR